ncbi:MAG: hypothetical protein IJ767_06055 [Bacteroidaceae bacterium]|nr:hypothetical protein [Bacteroidaceae bacterium]
MGRREQIERIIVGTLLSGQDYRRDVACIPPELIRDPLSRKAYEYALACPDAMPVNSLIRDCRGEDAALAVHAMGLSAFEDFDVRRNRYNMDALTAYYLGGVVHRPTSVEFRDYVSQFIRLSYGRTGDAS